MGVYISINRIADADEYVDYAFVESDRKPGIIRVNRSTGSMDLIENPSDYSEFVWRRAMRRLELHWKKGEYPERTCWAS